MKTSFDPDDALFRILACAEVILDGDDTGRVVDHEVSVEIAAKMFELHDWLRTGHPMPEEWRKGRREQR